MASLFGMLKRHSLFVIAFVLIASEAALLFVFIPIPSKASQVEAAHIEAGIVNDGKAEVPIGDLSVRNHQIPGDEYMIRFGICLVTTPEEMDFLQSRFDEHQQKVREAASVVARRASVDVLRESSLTTFKRRLRVAIASAMQLKEDQEFEVVLPDFLMQK
ncbi:hypothetical protein K2Y11_15910 [bacterium]|nr:hypothetical protein [bacterium]